MARAVWVISHHYDRGSDEVRIEGAYSTLEKAREAFKKKFPNYKPDPEVESEPDWADYQPDAWWYYADPDDTSTSDRAQIHSMLIDEE